MFIERSLVNILEKKIGQRRREVTLEVSGDVRLTLAGQRRRWVTLAAAETWGVRPASIDPNDGSRSAVKGFACYSLSFSRPQQEH